MQKNIHTQLPHNIFFIGVAGAGMSALAQYLQQAGKKVSGSDREFKAGTKNDMQQKLEAAGIQTFLQDASGITPQTELVVVSTAIEDTVAEVKKAKELSIPIIKRSELLAKIADTKRTIAVGGTSGKSTTVGMLFTILEYNQLNPSVISGAGLTSLIKQGKIGNAKANSTGEWLIIEADESDKSIVQYTPEVGIVLNIDKDHQEIDELIELFSTFKKNTKNHFIVNASNAFSHSLQPNQVQNFGISIPDDNEPSYLHPTNVRQHSQHMYFTVNGVDFSMQGLGIHNIENALAAISAANYVGIPLHKSAEALKTYEGIYRRHQILGEKNGVTVVDDYAHNPAKCAASIKAVQPLGKKTIAWFQPHGYGPTKFLRKDFVEEIAKALRPNDEIWMSEIYYAGGSAVKDISAKDLIDDLRAKNMQAFFVEDRNKLLEIMKSHIDADTTILLMGARDPSLEKFSAEFYNKLS